MHKLHHFRMIWAGFIEQQARRDQTPDGVKTMPWMIAESYVHQLYLQAKYMPWSTWHKSPGKEKLEA
eukprot:12883416-Prorocentrum_lima.AAC.1